MSSKERLKILYNFYDNEQNDSMSYEQVVDKKYKNDIKFFSKIEKLPENKLIEIVFKKNNKFNILEATNRFLEQLKKNDIKYKKKNKKRKLK